MKTSKSLEKLAKYYERLAAGKAKKIKPSHVQEVIDKLESRERSLQEEIQGTKKNSKKDRLEGKRITTLEQLDRARWLLKEIT